MTEPVKRPPGHVSDCLRELERWKKNRINCHLETKSLSWAIALLEEYREWCAWRLKK